MSIGGDALPWNLESTSSIPLRVLAVVSGAILSPFLIALLIGPK